MKAMVLSRLGSLRDNPTPLELKQVPDPVPGHGEILVRVLACGVCHTELDEIEGRMPPRLPVIPGHQAIGRVAETGAGATSFLPGDRVGVAWIHSACGHCVYCRSGRENLCPEFKATGRDVDGGYAEYLTVPEAFACRVPDRLADIEAAPLLCAGAIGWRSLALSGLADGGTLGLTGFGASGHLVLKMVRQRYPRARIIVFARRPEERRFATELGAAWAGDLADEPPETPEAIIDTTPAWGPVIASLKHLAPGGRLVINAIRKETADRDALLSLDYPAHLWMEKEIKSVANVTRGDVGSCLALAAAGGIRPEVSEYPLEEANRALRELKASPVRGAKVLTIQRPPA